MTTSATKDLPVGFRLSDWTWGVVNPCEDYKRISQFMMADATSPTGLRYINDHRKAGEKAGNLKVCRAGTGTKKRKRDYATYRVVTRKCVDPWAPKQARLSPSGVYQCQAAAVVWLLTTGNWPPPHFVVDHIDINATNNNPDNIRLVTRGMNVSNRVRKTSSKRRNVVLKKFDRIAEPLVAIKSTYVPLSQEAS